MSPLVILPADASAPDPGEALLAEVEIQVARGDAMFGLRDARIALVVGVLHGLGAEEHLEAARQTAVAAARAGYALRLVEELAGAVAEVAPLRRLIFALQQERPALMHWDAMQIAAWEAMEPSELMRQLDVVDARDLAGHPVRDALFVELADAAREAFGGILESLPRGDSVHAVRFGYGVRLAEQSLPDDASRLLRDSS